MVVDGAELVSTCGVLVQCHIVCMRTTTGLRIRQIRRSMLIEVQENNKHEVWSNRNRKQNI